VARRGPRRAVAAGLRRLAFWLARRLFPRPSAVPAAGGPPEHWRALVAARAPGLLRGEGMSVQRVRRRAAPIVTPSPVPEPPLLRSRPVQVELPAPEPAAGPVPAVPEPLVRQRFPVRVSTGPGLARPTPPATPTLVSRGAPIVRVIPPTAPVARVGLSTVDGWSAHRRRARAAVATPPAATPPANPSPVESAPTPRWEEPVASAPLPEEPVASAPLPEEPAAPWPSLPMPVVPDRAHGARLNSVDPVVSRGADTPLAPGVPPVARPVVRVDQTPVSRQPVGRPASPAEPDPWPELPDDSPLWTIPPVPASADRLRRLDREQAGR
jgi:hypothetical protein